MRQYQSVCRSVVRYVIPDGECVGSIRKGVLVLLGIDRHDTKYVSIETIKLSMFRETMERVILKSLKVSTKCIVEYSCLGQAVVL